MIRRRKQSLAHLYPLKVRCKRLRNLLGGACGVEGNIIASSRNFTINVNARKPRLRLRKRNRSANHRRNVCLYSSSTRHISCTCGGTHLTIDERLTLTQAGFDPVCRGDEVSTRLDAGSDEARSSLSCHSLDQRPLLPDLASPAERHATLQDRHHW